MRAFLYTGGECDPASVAEHPAPGDLILAADIGYRTAQKCGAVPAILLGDFDSLGTPPDLSGTEILRVPAEKDFTDTQYAVRIALERGADQIVFVGGLGGRLDHTLSNLSLLESLYEKRVPALITTGKTRVRYLKNNSLLLLRDSRYRYLSLICADRKVKGVTLRGCRYPLEGATLFRNDQYAVSNEWTESCAFLGVRRGGVFVIEEAFERKFPE